MLKNSKTRFGAVAALAVGALAFGAVAPANADPGTGIFRDLVGVGSDTTQDVMNGIAVQSGSIIASYDATGSATIQVSAGGPTFARPNGSGNGVRALSASINDTGTRTFPASGGVSITNQVDFARSSSAPSGGGTGLTFIPFAQDAVTYAVNVASDFPRDIPLGTAAQDSVSPAPFTLRNIYRSVATTYTDRDFNTVTIRPLLPQAGSGTRAFWVGALGLNETAGDPNRIGATVTDLGGANVQEHNGFQLKNAGDIVPFSIAQWIAQSNWKQLPTAVEDRRYQADLGNIGTVRPYVLGANGIELNGSFPVSRLVFNVVQTSRITGGSADPQLVSTFAGPTSTVCSADNIVRQYGFGVLDDSVCGDITTFTQGLRY